MTNTAAVTPFTDLAAEFAATRRALARYPDGRGAWTPHPKSRPLGALATHVADIASRGSVVLETDALDVAGRQPRAPLDSAEALLAAFDANTERFHELLAAADDEWLDRVWSLKAGDRVLVAAPKRALIRTMMISHLIHHRAQLGVYYRLLDIPVPSAYGPTADEGM